MVAEKRRMILRYLLTLALVAAWAIVSRPAAAAPVRIAYSSISGAMLPLWVAKERGLFDKHGVDVEVMYVRGVSVEALLSGEVQFIRASPPSVVRSTLKGADLVVIANTINVPVFSLMTTPEIKRPEDLKGRKIGVTNLGDSPDLVLSLILEKWGLQRSKDVSVLAIRGGMPELMISAPSNLRGLKLGLRELVDASTLGISYLNSPLSTRRSTIKAQRDMVLRVLRGYHEGVQSTRNDRDSTLKILSKYVRVDNPDILSDVYQIYGSKHLQADLSVQPGAVNGLLKGLGAEAAKANPASFVDTSLLHELHVR